MNGATIHQIAQHGFCYVQCPQTLTRPVVAQHPVCLLHHSHFPVSERVCAGVHHSWLEIGAPSGVQDRMCTDQCQHAQKDLGCAMSSALHTVAATTCHKKKHVIYVMSTVSGARGFPSTIVPSGAEDPVQSSSPVTASFAGSAWQQRGYLSPSLHTITCYGSPQALIFLHGS